MLQSAIVVSKMRDSKRPLGSPDDRDDGLATRQLNARSLALSALLGTHPPALPARALVALAELFGIAGGTMRTALSRMTAAGEIESSSGWYRLTGRLLARQEAQDTGRRRPSTSWDGRWHTVIAAADQRDLADRRHFRTVLSSHRFGELRPDTWLRPANLPVPELGEAAFVLTGTLDRSDEPLLVGRLWDLATIADGAGDLVRRIAEHRSTVDVTTSAAIPSTFTLAASVVRFLRDEPLLPDALLPTSWPVDRLRDAYDDLERDLQTALRAFLRAQRD
jgi:phenylacetic acid degradation operon negative regulatory protein